MTAPSIKDALERLIADIEDYERVNNLAPSPGKKDCWQSVTNAKAAIATLQPDGERREAIARIICYWDEPSTCHDNYCVFSCRAKTPDARFFKSADAILASGLVQDEAGIRRDEREKCAKIAEERAIKLREKAKSLKQPHNQHYFAQAIEASIIADHIRSARDGGAS